MDPDECADEERVTFVFLVFEDIFCVVYLVDQGLVVFLVIFILIKL